MQEQHIDISLEFNQRQLDLRVPTAVTFARLSELIGQVLHDRGIVMPTRWHLEVRSKPIAISDFDIVGDFPLADGDVLAVVGD